MKREVYGKIKLTSNNLQYTYTNEKTPGKQKDKHLTLLNTSEIAGPPLLTHNATEAHREDRGLLPSDGSTSGQYIFSSTQVDSVKK